jgi:hypothetical protein
MWGGGNAAFNLLYTNPLKENRIIDAVPEHGTFGLADGRLIVPGHPERSVILERMGKLGIGRMPLLATSVVDEQAVALVREWISSLGTAAR